MEEYCACTQNAGALEIAQLKQLHSYVHLLEMLLHERLALKVMRILLLLLVVLHNVVTQSADMSATQPSPVSDYSADMHTCHA